MIVHLRYTASDVGGKSSYRMEKHPHKNDDLYH